MQGAILQITKRDRLRTIAKIVDPPAGEVALAISYRNRQVVTKDLWHDDESAEEQKEEP